MSNPLPPQADPVSLQTLAALASSPAPTSRHVWTALVDVGEREALGMASHGERFIVPILGGRFWGEPGFESLRGHIRGGGADRQLLRPDGVKQLHALYEMQTDDGAVLTIDNQVVIDESVQPERYALSRITVSAPTGPAAPHAWLNRRVLVGTLQSLRPHRAAVVVRAYVVST